MTSPLTRPGYTQGDSPVTPKDPPGGAASISDIAYAASWNGVTDVAPSKNAVYDKIETLSGGTPGGSDTQLQYNNAGAFGGIPGFTWDGSTLLIVADQILNLRSGDIGIYSPTVGTLALVGTTLFQFIADRQTLLDSALGATMLDVISVASSVNYLELKPSATGNPLLLTAKGTDANVGINFVAKGSGNYQLGGVASTGTGGMVRATSPTLVTPALGTPSAITLTNATISALSIWVANSANTVTQVTPGAGNSIRINADGTAWEAYTPGTGGGHTIRENGTDQTSRTGLNFIDTDAGAGLITDDAGGNETEVNLALYTLLTGRSGGQTLIGGTAASDSLILESTSHATKGTVRSRDNFIIGNAVAATDYTLTFDGETNDGVLTWMEDEDYFAFSDDLFLNTTERLYFRSTNNYLYSNAADELTLTAPTLCTIGADGDIDCFGATLRQFRPAQAGKGDLGSTSKPWLNLHLQSTVATYNNITTVSNGVSSILGTADLTAQTAAKAATTLYTPAATGMFRISVALKVTTAATTSSTLGAVTITYTSGDGSVAQSIVLGMNTAAGAYATTSTTNSTTTSTLSGVLIIYALTGVAIQYAIAYTSSGGTPMAYSAHLKCEAM